MPVESFRGPSANRGRIDVVPRRVPLPPPLRDRAFLIAEAKAAGLGEGRLTGADLRRPFHGVRSVTSAENLLDRCRDYEPLLRAGHHFSHLTAAWLWGCPLPPNSGVEIHVSCLAPDRAPRSRGMIGHQAAAQATVDHRLGLPVSSAATTWLSLAALLPLDELVVCGDHLILDPAVLDPRDLRPHVTLSELTVATDLFRGRGARAAARALQWLRQGAESRPETLLRLLIVRAGMPEPELNIDVRDSAGRFLGRGDLVYPRWRVLVEYDGDEHRINSRQYDKDILRIENFVNAGWRVVRVRKNGLFVHPATVVERVGRALSAAGWSC
jgi:hypothetical protein